jgi:3-oxoacyl-[acyl-carrier protein] reductase
MRLKGKSAIVTGAGRGIGKAIARRFLEEGAQVMICDLNEDRLVAAHEELSASGQVHSQVVDVTCREAVEYLAGQAKRAFGRIDVLTNNAGISRFEPFLEITDENWNDTLATNLTGVFLCSQVVATEMKSQGSGAIVNIGSTNSILGRGRTGPLQRLQGRGYPSDQDDGHRAGTSQRQGQLRLPRRHSSGPRRRPVAYRGHRQ